jgi:putative tryptophan/tyrosine transport system substrate-binding protein
MDLRWAEYVDRILQGANLVDVPVPQRTNFELAINLRTAKAIDLIAPPSRPGRVNEVSARNEP